jgi:multiple antibiotic resistance protein
MPAGAEMVAQVFTVFLTVLILIDPLGLTPIFIALTRGMSRRERRRVMMKSVTAAFFVLSFFIFAGESILDFLGILPGSFFVAGGILFFIISLDLLLGHRQRTKTSRREMEHHEDCSVFPLAVPILAGPGTITTIIIYSVEAVNSTFVTIVLFGSVAVSLLLCFILMAASTFILRILRETGVSVIQRLMGLILSGLAIQFIYDGLVKLNVV